MVEGDHGVGFTTAEVGLECHHRISSLAGKTLESLNYDVFQSFGDISAAEEFLRVLVLVLGLARTDLR